VDNKMWDFNGIFALEVEQRKWGWHPLFDIFITTPSLFTFGPTFF
jgi:hypothetical protein